MDNSNPKVTVIMRTRNSEDTIGEALEQLFAQDFKDFVLLVVDSESTDRTVEIVQGYPHEFLDIPPGDYYPGDVLNQAIRRSNSDIVVFVNSDVIALTDASLRHLVAAFEDPEVQAAFGRQAPRPEAVSWVRRDYAVSYPERGPAPAWQKLSLPFAALRKSAWEQHPFYTAAYSSEDTEWGNWALSQGYKIAYVPEALVMHSHNYTFKEISARRFVEGEADAFIYGERFSLLDASRRYLAVSARDLAWYVKHLDILGIPSIPVRRFIYQWAYYKGRKFGELRIARGISDPSLSQKLVKKRIK